MPSLITTRAVDRSTYAVDVSFTDESGSNVSPNSGLTWSLFDCAGAVINNRGSVSIASAGTVTILLYGADIDYDDGDERYLLVEGTYSNSLGTALPIRDEAQFFISNLVGA
jgi:hypothetical protein